MGVITWKFNARISDIRVQNLYDQGGRAFWIHNVGPNGCLPAAQKNILNRTQESFDKNGCINRWNERVMEYNRQLKDRVIKLRAALPEAAITYVDVYTAKYKLISNAKNLGFTNPLKICIAHKGNRNGREVEVGLCENPSTYISWDGVQYTEAANHLIAKSILNELEKLVKFPEKIVSDLQKFIAKAAMMERRFSLVYATLLLCKSG